MNVITNALCKQIKLDRYIEISWYQTLKPIITVINPMIATDNTVWQKDIFFTKMYIIGTGSSQRVNPLVSAATGLFIVTVLAGTRGLFEDLV